MGGQTPATHYAYNDDGDLASVTRPDGSTVGMHYDDAGRLDKVSDPASGDTTYGYSSTSGQLAAAGSPDGEHTAYAYDGVLLTNESLTGQIAGSTSRTYDNDMRISSTSVDGGSTANYGYDVDGRLTTAGDLTIGRDASTGFESGTTLAQTSTTQSYDAYGDLASFTASASGAPVFGETILHRDDLGRVKERTETSDGASHTYEYTYYPSGRLEQVERDGALFAQYTYDANGNRQTQTRADGATVNGTYDDQDRLTSYGAKRYTYTPNGELATRTDTANGRVERTTSKAPAFRFRALATS